MPTKTAALSRLLKRFKAHWTYEVAYPKAGGRFVSAEFDPVGRLTHLALLFEAGGIAVPEDAEPLAKVAHVVSELSEIFGIPGSFARQAVAAGLVLEEHHTVPGPTGIELTFVYTTRIVGGMRVVDSEQIFAFRGRRFLSFNGPFYGELFGRKPTHPRLSRQQAEAALLTHSGGRAVTVLKANIGYYARSGATVWDMVALVDGDEAEGLATAVREIRVDAVSGEVLSDLLLDRSASQEGRVAAYRPDNAGVDAQQVVETRLPVWLPDHRPRNTIVVLGKRDVPSRSPIDVYDGSVRTTEGALLYRAHGVRDHLVFNQAPGTTTFNAQHAYRWTHYAYNIGDLNLRFFPAARRAWQHYPLKVLVNTAPLRRRDGTRRGAAVMGGDGCWNYLLWDHPAGIKRGPCIDFQSGSPSNGYGQPAIAAQATLREGERVPIWTRVNNRVSVTPVRIGVAFHEVGHAVDWKYKLAHTRHNEWTPPPEGPGCRANTPEEGNSLDEAVGALYGYMLFLHFKLDIGQFPWLNYEAGGAFDVGIFSADGVEVSQGPETQWCHPYVRRNDTFVGLVGCDQTYHYRRPLLQAYWEVANGMSCGGPGAIPCSPLANAPGLDEARWALFLAMKLTTRGAASYRTFVSNMLSGFLLEMGQVSWATRFAVFARYNLAGPFQTEAECGGRLP